MKKLKHPGAVLLALALTLALATSALAVEPIMAPGEYGYGSVAPPDGGGSSHAGDDETGYTVRIFAGAKGTVNGGNVVVFSNLKYGSRVTFDRSCLVLNPADNNKYYYRGIRESGLDNANADDMDTPSILVTRDIDYVVAYGIKGDTVKYTVRYEDMQGNTLLEPQEYYGNIGDRVVVAYRYIEGWTPQYYNIRMYLQEDETQNVLTFRYVPVGEGEGGTVVVERTGDVTDYGIVTETVTVPGAGGDAAGAGAGAGADAGAGDAGAGGDAGDAGGVDIPDENVPQAPGEILDLDEPDTPLANGDGLLPKIIADASALPMGSKIMFVGGGVLLLGALIWLLLLFRKKKEQEEDE